MTRNSTTQTRTFNYTTGNTVGTLILRDGGSALASSSWTVAAGTTVILDYTGMNTNRVGDNAGITLSEQTRDSTVCMAGFISHKALIENYGLTPAQADDFFASPTTIRLNVSGSVQYVGEAHMVFGLRVVGD